MAPDSLPEKTSFFLNTLCGVRPNRRTGSAGNRQATDFFTQTIRPYGFEIDATPFKCLDYIDNGSILMHGQDIFDVHTSPYSSACDVTAALVVVSTVEELDRADCTGKILLMKGEICSEQLMPKNFIFYNPEHHQRVIALLESKKPAGIITATARNPEQVGALYPFPLIADGDFDIPNVYCRDTVGEDLALSAGDIMHLEIMSERLPSSATNIIASLNRTALKKIVLTAHIDAYESTPGALDNASGTTVLLLLAEMLHDYLGERCIEIAVFNGEDHYSAGGEMDYVRRYSDEFPKILLAVNLDDLGYRRGKSSYSFYECPTRLKQQAKDVLGQYEGLVQGDQWFNGDHMIFVQSGVPSMTYTSISMGELMQNVVHTASDTPDLIDCRKLVEVAKSLNALVRSL